MKMKVQTRLVVSNRAMLALGFGCALATLPVSFVSAQDSSSTTARTSGTVDMSKPAEARPKLSGDEQKFVMEAGAANAAEVKLAELALKNGESDGVKKFAQQMITDHTMSNKELAGVAQRENITDFAPEPNDEQKATAEKLMALKGKEFDSAYVKQAVADHSKVLDSLKQAHNDVTSKDLLAFVNKTEPTVASHLKMAKMLEKSESK